MRYLVLVGASVRHHRTTRMLAPLDPSSRATGAVTAATSSWFDAPARLAAHAVRRVGRGTTRTPAGSNEKPIRGLRIRGTHGKLIRHLEHQRGGWSRGLRTPLPKPARADARSALHGVKELENHLSLIAVPSDK